MGDDAMEIWRRETAGGPMPGDGPTGPPPEDLETRRWRLEVATLASAAVGALVAALVLFAHGWPPPLSPVSPAFALAPAAAFGLALLLGRRPGSAAWAAVAGATGAAITVCVVVPVWGVLEVLDCWMSWLADC